MRILTIIPHFHKDALSHNMLYRCLYTIALHEPLLRHHVIVIDDGSPDVEAATKSMNHMQDRFGIKTVRRDVNTTYSDVINQGFKIAEDLKYDWVLFMNNDIELTMPFVKRWHQLAVSMPELGMIGPLLLYPNGRIQSAGITFVEPGRGGVCGEHEKGHLLNLSHHAGLTKFVNGVTGAFQFVNIKLYQAIGGYNNQYQLAYEDVEYCLRALNHGMGILYDPTQQHIHAESMTRGYFPKAKEIQSDKLITDLWTRAPELVWRAINQTKELNEKYKLPNDSLRKL
jgi:O-antigen biosynthesis protein